MSDIQYRLITDATTDEIFHDVAVISGQVFPGTTIDKAIELNRNKLEGRKSILIIIAYEGKKPVGFKQGYETSPGYFESESGGVLESVRRHGIANEMMRQQHHWCLNNGFRFVETNVANDNQPMLILNLKHGFQVVGTYLDRGSIQKVLLQKQIAEL